MFTVIAIGFSAIVAAWLVWLVLDAGRREEAARQKEEAELREEATRRETAGQEDAPEPDKTDEARVLVSYLALRRVLGVLGIALPFLLALWGFALADRFEIQGSLSAYYGFKPFSCADAASVASTCPNLTSVAADLPSAGANLSLRTRDILIGVLFAIAWFLFTYKGYERRDDVAGYLGCLFALGVALFPSSGAVWEKAVHFTSAFGLFVVLSVFCLLFTKSNKSPDEWKPQKRVRNRIYWVCAWVIWVCLGLAILYLLFLQDATLGGFKLSEVNPVFWLESFMIWAFAISWFIKGEALVRDPDSADDEIPGDATATAPA